MIIILGLKITYVLTIYKLCPIYLAKPVNREIIPKEAQACLVLYREMKQQIKIIFLTLVIILFSFTGCAKKTCIQCGMNSEQIKEQESYWQNLNYKMLELYKQGKLKEAVNLGKDSLNFANKTFGKDSLKAGTSLNNLGELYRLDKKFGDAEWHYKKSLEIREKLLGKEHPEVALTLNNLASVYFAENRFNDAQTTYETALKVMEKSPQKDSRSLIALIGNLAELYKSTGKLPKAEAEYKKLLTLREKIAGKNDLNYAKALNDLGALYFLEGKYTEAEPVFKNTLTILEEKLGKNHPDLSVVLENILEVYKKIGDNVKAKAFEERIKGIRTTSQSPS